MNARVRLSIHVAPGARRPGLVGRYGDGWKVRVSAPPERGRANDAVAALLAVTLGISRRDVTVVAGSTSRDKVVALTGLTSADVEERLARAANQAAS